LAQGFTGVENCVFQVVAHHCQMYKGKKKSALTCLLEGKSMKMFASHYPNKKNVYLTKLIYEEVILNITQLL